MKKEQAFSILLDHGNPEKALSPVGAQPARPRGGNDCRKISPGPRSMKKMKILFMSLGAYPLFNRSCRASHGGAEVQLYHLAGELARDDGITVYFIVGDFGQAALEVYDNVNVIRGYPWIMSNVRYLRGLFGWTRLFVRLAGISPDICVQRAAGTETGLLALYCRLFSKKFVYMAAHVMDCSGQYIKSRGVPGSIFGYGLKKASLVLAQNEEQQRLLRDNYNIESRTVKSGYLIPDEPTSPDSKKGYALWVARLDDFKRPELFIRLAREFEDENFVMIAPLSGDAKYDADIEQSAAERGNIRFIPGVPFDKVDRYFEEARLFVNTSTGEGFPNTFIQAAMYSTPILSLSVDPDGILEKENLGYCAGGDWERFREYFQKLLRNEDDWRGKAADGYRYARDNHDLKKSAGEFKKILEAL